jgi:hypothetical protein
MGEKKTSVYVSRSQSFVEKASKIPVDELTQHVRETFADDLRKARDYAEEKLNYTAVTALNAVTETLNLKVKARPASPAKQEKYTKRLEVVFHKNANKDYRAFLLAGLDKEGVLVSSKDEKFVYAFLPEKFERIKIKVKALTDITANDVSK